MAAHDIINSKELKALFSKSDSLVPELKSFKESIDMDDLSSMQIHRISSFEYMLGRLRSVLSNMKESFSEDALSSNEGYGDITSERQVFIHKNFDLNMELNTASEFIHDGLIKLHRIRNFSNPAAVFTSLYYVAVGIERLEKIVLILNHKDLDADFKKFENSIRTHQLPALMDTIYAELPSFRLHEDEYALLSLLSDFYGASRYDRMRYKSQHDTEIALLSDFVRKYVSQGITTDISCGKHLSDEAKTYLDSTVRSISRLLYKQIGQLSTANGTFTYELDWNTDASEVMVSKRYLDKDNTIPMTDELAMRELLVYLRNSKDSNAFLRFMDSIEPLSIDPGLVNDFIHNAINGSFSDLGDEVAENYNNLDDVRDRAEMIGCIGSLNCMFDMAEIDRIHSSIKSFLDGERNIPPKEFARELNTLLSAIGDSLDDDMLDELNKILEKYGSEITSEGGFIGELQEYCNRYSYTNDPEDK